MAVTAVRQVRNGQNGGFMEFSPSKMQPVRGHVLTYQVDSNSVSDTEFDIISGGYAYGLPQLFDTYQGNPLTRVRRITPTRDTRTTGMWEVQVEYSSEMPDPANVSQSDNPLAAKVQRSIGSKQIQVPMWKDLNNVDVKNSAGFQFDPPIMVQRSVLVMRFVRNEQLFNIAKWAAYHDHVNSANWAGLSPGTVYCEIASEEMYSKSIKYFRTTYEFSYDPRGWQPKIVDQGWKQKLGGEISEITDADGRAISQPWPLDGSGGAIDPVVQDLVYLDFKGYPTANFNALGLPLGA